MERGVRRAAQGAESDFKRTGEGIGDAMAGGIGADLRTHGRDFQDSVERATQGRTIQTRWGWRDRNSGRFIRKLGDDIEEEIGEAFESINRPGGPLSKFGQGVADAIGAGFNISGRSPLIGVLAVALLAIVGIILAAVQAVSALVAVLGTLPALLTAIGLQVAVVMVAFQGIGTAISGAFAAKNVTELNEALKGLTPSAQKFVKSLLPAKKLFSDLKAIIQENFFQGFGDSLANLLDKLGPVLRGGFGPLAQAMGRLFAQLTDFFASKGFIRFVAEIFPRTIKFLERFGPSFVTFLEGLITIAQASLPFLTDVGTILSSTFETIGLFLDSVPHNSNFMGWLTDMRDTLISLQGLFFSLLGFLRDFSDVLNKAGGNELIDELTAAFAELSFFLQSDIGQASIRALVNLGILGIQSFTGLVIAVLAVMGAFQQLGEFITGPFSTYFVVGFTAIGKFFEWLGNKILQVFDFIVDKVSSFVAMIVLWVLRLWVLGRTYITNFFNEVRALPGKVLAALANFGSLLLAKGRALIDGLIQGIRDRFAALRQTISNIANTIAGFLPGSPAKEGPLAGRGYALYRGQRMIDDFVQGMKMEAPQLRDASMDAVSNIVFGPNSVRVGFEGVVPTPDQARITGSAAGQGILNQLAARNTRLAVRTL